MLFSGCVWLISGGASAFWFAKHLLQPPAPGSTDLFSMDLVFAELFLLFSTLYLVMAGPCLLVIKAIDWRERLRTTPRLQSKARVRIRVVAGGLLPVLFAVQCGLLIVLQERVAPRLVTVGPRDPQEADWMMAVSQFGFWGALCIGVCGPLLVYLAELYLSNRPKRTNKGPQSAQASSSY
jgi:hypothetical protein